MSKKDLPSSKGSSSVFGAKNCLLRNAFYYLLPIFLVLFGSSDVFCLGVIFFCS